MKTVNDLIPMWRTTEQGEIAMGDRRRLWLPVIVSLVLLATPAMAGGGDANLWVGKKQISDETLEEQNVDDPTQWGAWISLDFDWPVALAIDLLISGDDDSRTDTEGNISSTVQTDVDILELDLGVRKFWGQKARPYVGGGLAIAQADAQVTEQLTLGMVPLPAVTLLDNSDTGLGYWLNGGFLYTFGKSFNLGADLRYSDASVSLQPTDLAPGEPAPSLDVDAGGFQFGVMLGFRW
jgi:opacity protein-like surface antigen